MPEPTEMLDLLAAAKCFPGDPATAAIWRWCRKGCKSRRGERVYLEHRRVGGKLYTTKTWCEEFQKRLASEDLTHFRTANPDAEEKPPDQLPQWWLSDSARAIDQFHNEGLSAFARRWREVAEIAESLPYLPDSVRLDLLRIARTSLKKDLGPEPTPLPKLLPEFDTKTRRTAQQRAAAIRQARLEIAALKKKKWVAVAQ